MTIEKKIIIAGQKAEEAIELLCTPIIMGSGDFLRKDNLACAGPILDEFIIAGGNTFDTARHYRYSEEALGIWIAERGNRDQINILTKCCHPVRGALEITRVTPEAIEVDLQESLRLLKTDHVEMLALHRDDETKEVGPLMEKLNEIVVSGRAYSIGVSNWQLPRIIEAQNYCRQNRLIPLTFQSPNFSLAKVNIPRWPDCVSADKAMIQWHEETKLPLLSWSSQAGGLFSGRFSPENREDAEMVAVYYNEENWKRYARAKELAEVKGCTPIQLSLAYVLNQPFPTGAIIGSENQIELDFSLEAAKIRLTSQEIAYLDLKTNSFS